jgi:hypothetical protein
MKTKLLSSINLLMMNLILNKVFNLISLSRKNIIFLKNQSNRTKNYYIVNNASLTEKNMRFKMFYSFISKMKVHLNFWLINKEVKSLKYR